MDTQALLAEQRAERKASRGHVRAHHRLVILEPLAQTRPELVQSDVVPEPGTSLLVSAGLLGLAGWRRARA